MLDTTQTKKCKLEFHVCSTDIADLAKLVDTGLRRGILYDNLELSIEHGRIK